MEPPVDKSELPPPAVSKRPSQGSQHGMCLPLHGSDQSNNAFIFESSLSSSSTSPLYYRGEASPDSMRSLCSLSSARTDSPLDVDMPEVEMGKITASSDDSGIQSPECRPDCSESNDNDNSVSVYLDANEECWSDDEDDNHNVALVVTQKVGQTDNDDERSLCSSENDEEEEEDSFLSLASADLVIKNQIGVSALETKTNTLSDISQGQTEEGQLQNSNLVLNLATVNDLEKEVDKEKDDLSVELVPVTQSTDVMNEPVVSPGDSEGNEICIITSDTKNKQINTSSNEENQPKSTAKMTNDLAGRAMQTKTPTRASLTKATKPELKRFPRPDLRNVKAKIISRAALAPRSTNPRKTNANLCQSPSSIVNKLPARGRGSGASRKVEDKAVVKRSRSSSSHARGAESKTSDSPESDPEPKPTGLLLEKPVIESSVKDCQKQDVVILFLQTPDEETAIKSECPSLTDFIIEDAQLDKEADVKTSKCKNKTVSSKLGPSLGAASTNASTSAPPEHRLKPPGREARSTGGLGPPGSRAVQPAGISKMRTTDKSTTPCSPTTVSSCKGPQRASSKLPVKGIPTSPSSSSSTFSENNSIAVNKVPGEVMRNEEKSIKQSPLSQMQVKSPVSKPVSGHRSRTSSIPSKPVAGLKAPVVTSHVTAKNNQNALQRSGSARHVRSTTTTVDKTSKTPKAAGTTAGRIQLHSPAGGNVQTEEEEEKDLRIQNEKKSQCILQLRKLIANGNRRLEALALVVQHVFREREVAIKQKEELSVQLNNLRDQLGNSVSCCEQLEKDKEEVRVSLESLLQKLQEQHQNELQQLEEGLKEFYSSEWDKTHQAYQKEADKCRALMQQQVDEVRSKHETLRHQQEAAHAKQIETLKREHENSLAELRKAHEQHTKDLGKTLKESEASFNEKFQTLTAENETLKEKLRQEEERRRALADKSQKDAHTLYLEQELESLRAVLEIKTNQIHQQDKKLMQMDKLIDDNLKLEECLNKVQQENEDYRARMDKHAALSKQLSTEQAMLQQTLQKESKVNKRLSMENEELLWKLHNGDLCSPRRLSPTSPFHSPRNSASFSTTPISPR
ncbi:microtubule-associated tumor suppressor 1 homolog [Triplophysa rosa]|uniref:Microtubule-associated tumor suppressor 1 n=1 Tax=Triplophysa rosa TaxID=992332 RepID=A0A9W7WYZ7_TRIRA|nr:microtubule-associated tumor suppressor 1 homolog [Triplophysa rosa]XP_057187471.1 microtubule-associated tumor suppressor 1 homolog [Triplophysa rosa]XP_057187472.1 microtubule-associated tumor suppressor 1 homolog [Triplophysa rosa]KAI7810968.1 putative microtubule-associated tumor suppressor 1 [Triplophysa rosa]